MRNKDMKNYQAPEDEKGSLLESIVSWVLIIGLVMLLAYMTERNTHEHQHVQVIADPKVQQNEQVKL